MTGGNTYHYTTTTLLTDDIYFLSYRIKLSLSWNDFADQAPPDPRQQPAYTDHGSLFSSLISVFIRSYLNLSHNRAKESAPVLDATSSII